MAFSGCRAPLTPSPGLGVAAESSSTLPMLQELWRNHYLLSTEQANKHNPARRSRNFSPETVTTLSFTCQTCATTPGTANATAALTPGVHLGGQREDCNDFLNFPQRHFPLLLLLLLSVSSLSSSPAWHVPIPTFAMNEQKANPSVFICTAPPVPCACALECSFLDPLQPHTNSQRKFLRLSNAHRHPCGPRGCKCLFLGRMWAKPTAVASCPSAGHPPPCCVSPGMSVFPSLR